ncbi:MAG: bifunctional 4-hydroxy-2-oxoglutarate aldolase/2-dehydro-3-deoxy-phosphogluconate aldolase [Verrucomicrobiota bacterium]
MGSFSRERFESLPIVGILRGLPDACLGPLLDVVCRAGLTNIEITMNTVGAANQIRSACQLAGGRLNIGAGTVTDVERLEEALGAGASFIVTPTIVEPVLKQCAQAKIPVFPGAFSPTEILRAWDLGAAMVKVFPADAIGVGGIEALTEAMPELRLMPTGGVDVDTLAAFARAGAAGYGIGSPLFPRPRLAAGDWAWLEDRSRAFVRAYHQAHPAP